MQYKTTLRAGLVAACITMIYSVGASADYDQADYEDADYANNQLAYDEGDYGQDTYQDDNGYDDGYADDGYVEEAYVDEGYNEAPQDTYIEQEADYTDDYTDANQESYDEDKEWEAEVRAYCKELADYELPETRQTYLQDCLQSQLGY